MFVFFKRAKTTAMAKKAVEGVNSEILNPVSSMEVQKIITNMSVTTKRCNKWAAQKYGKLNIELLCLFSLIAMGKVFYGRKDFRQSIFMFEVANYFSLGFTEHKFNTMSQPEVVALNTMSEEIVQSLDWLLRYEYGH